MSTDSENGDGAWRRVVDAWTTYIEALQPFWAASAQRVEVIRRALHSPGKERALALTLIPSLPVAERKLLLNDLLQLASYGHGSIAAVRQIVQKLPRKWLLDRIEELVKPILEEGEEEEYRRLLELFVKLDRDLTLRLARQALQHADEGVREAGEDFLHELEGRHARTA
jgi:hypothetical protein